MEFEFDDREVAVVLPTVPVNAVAFAGDGNLIVATDTGVSKYRLDGKIAWTTPVDGGVFGVVTDTAGRIFATSPSSVFALSPAGAVLWTQPVGVDTPVRNLYSMMSPVQIDPDGTVVAVRTSGGAAVFRRNGTPRFQTADGFPDGMAVAADGTVTFGVLSADQPFQLELHRYSATGTLLSPLTLLPGDNHASFAYDANGNLGWLTGAFSHLIGATSPALTTIWAQRSSLADFTSPHGIAFDSGGDLAAAYTGNGGITIEQYTPTGTIQFQTVKTLAGAVAPINVPVSIASDRGKRIAVAGDLDFQPWISVYQLP